MSIHEIVLFWKWFIRLSESNYHDPKETYRYKNIQSNIL